MSIFSISLNGKNLRKKYGVYDTQQETGNKRQEIYIVIVFNVFPIGRIGLLVGLVGLLEFIRFPLQFLDKFKRSRETSLHGTGTFGDEFREYLSVLFH